MGQDRCGEEGRKEREDKMRLNNPLLLIIIGIAAIIAGAVILSAAPKLF